ncbi:MAG: AfsR/SARP family transcriptional regulator [Actinomycetota bacterium]|nr:AfsR/SARP family transcriptional regulator [Actinomycetota bacterium]
MESGPVLALPAGAYVIEFRVLGSLEVVEGDRPLALGSPRQRALLAVLLMHRGEPVSRDRLIDHLWGELVPSSAHKIVQGYVSNLRKVLGDRALVTVGRGYLLQAGPTQLDRDCFESLVKEARNASQRGDARTAAEQLCQALALWRGPPFSDFAYESFAQSEIARLQESRLAGLEARVDADLVLGEHAQLIAELQALGREHPLREGFIAQLMLALYRSGRQAEALDAYQHARIRLAEELGLEPGPALKTLEIQILEQAPALQASPVSGHDAHRLAAGDRGGGASVLPRPPTPLIGREGELNVACGLIEGSDARLVTLTGPGGVSARRDSRSRSCAGSNRRSPTGRAGSSWPAWTARRMLDQRLRARWRPHRFRARARRRRYVVTSVAGGCCLRSTTSSTSSKLRISWPGCTARAGDWRC